VKPRTIEQLEKVFREIGLNETTWGKQVPPLPEASAEPASSREQMFIRIETTTTPLEQKDANLA
jgi:hypothetical protein